MTSPTRAETAAADQANRRNAVAAIGAVVAIVATAFLYNKRLLDPRMFFYADDWQWLLYGEFIPWSVEYFPVLPKMAYNDRPLGMAFIKALYQSVGLNYRLFQIALLLLHAVNCVLLYAIARRYVGFGGALVAALLCAVWFSANTAIGWVAAIFDVLGATLCLATVLLRQLALENGNRIRHDLAGAACYLLAIRTKEFALGAIAVLVVMNLLVERQTIRATVRQLVPYLIVFAVYALCYAQLIATTGTAPGDAYHLDMSAHSIAGNLAFYVRHLFYVHVVDPMIVAALIVGFGAGMLRAGENAQRTALFAMAAYVIMLGPALLLPEHRDPLYLYAPHFFVALMIGALVVGRVLPALAAVAASVALMAAPSTAHHRRHILDYYLDNGQKNQAMFNSAVDVLTPLPAGATVFISGLKPFFNPFSSGAGHSLRVAFKDVALKVEIEQPEAELTAKFCATSGEKRFLRFERNKATDASGDIARRCDRP